MKKILIGLLAVSSFATYASCSEELSKGQVSYNKAKLLETSSRRSFSDAINAGDKSPDYCVLVENALLQASNANQSYFLSEVAYSSAAGICSVEMEEKKSNIASKNASTAQKRKELSALLIELAVQELKDRGCKVEENKPVI